MGRIIGNVCYAKMWAYSFGLDYVTLLSHIYSLLIFSMILIFFALHFIAFHYKKKICENITFMIATFIHTVTQIPIFLWPIIINLALLPSFAQVQAIGQSIGAILATDRSAALKAAKLVKVQYQDLEPCVLTIQVCWTHWSNLIQSLWHDLISHVDQLWYCDVIFYYIANELKV